MTITVWPVDAVSGAPSYTGRMLRQTANALWAPNGARPLGARYGVVAGTSTGIVTATSTTWSCGVHRGVLDLEANAVEGAYAYSVDAAVSGALAAADSTYSRIDIVYVQLSDPAAGDGTTTPSVQVLYQAGTPAASPVAPTTPARSMVLAQITVPKAGGGAPSVTFVAPFTVALGGILPASAAQRPGAPYVGQYVDDPTAGLMRWDGSEWELYASQAYVNQSKTRAWSATPRSGTSDNFSGGSFAQLQSVTIAGAPAGTYQAVARLMVSGSAAGAGFARVTANGNNISNDPRADALTSRTLLTFVFPYVHAGGDLTFASFYELVSGTGTVWNGSSTALDAYWLGA